MQPDNPRSGRVPGPVLGFDTSAAHCAAALLFDGRIVDSRLVSMDRGQAEHLVPMLDDILRDAGVSWRDLSCLGVGIGPGIFTGVRIAVAAARGMALALGRPAFGVSLFEAMSLDLGPDPVLVSVEGRRGSAFVQPMEAGGALAPAAEIAPSEPPVGLAPGVRCVVGYEAARIGAASGLRVIAATQRPLADGIARVAQARWKSGSPQARPAPVYMRPADAAPPSAPPPVMLPG